MNAQEQQMLQGLVERVNGTSVTDKDPDAEQMIQQTLGRNPDALYVLAQTVLVQGYALKQAQGQIAELRGQLDQARGQGQETKHGSFLGNLLGRHDEPQRAAAPPPAAGPGPYAGTGYGPGLAYPAGGYPIPNAPSAGGGFLQSAMQTAAGVAAGAFAFEGIESLMHGFGHGGGFGGEYGGGRPEEVINNYYGDSSPREHREGFADGGASEFGGDRHESGLQDASFLNDGTDDQITNADDLSGTANTDYSSQQDDSMLSDSVGDSGGDFGGGDPF
ncbi:MAG TPA: DUF2076 domain-containing protein [Acidobacteriaceae bacterium]|nr:DUF2076 domain-containing protein [Acidobacteriaceae bacterium]